MTRLELFGKAMKWNAEKQIWEPHKLINHKQKVNDNMANHKDIDKSTSHSLENLPFRLKYTKHKCKVGDTITVSSRVSSETSSCKVLEVFDNDEYKVIII